MNRNGLHAVTIPVPPKKLKKSSNFAIYDALKAAQTSRPLATPTTQPAKGLHSNAARWNEILMPKTFIMKKKRKKKLSTFKKKILMERLQSSIKKRSDTFSPDDVENGNEVLNADSTSVYIFNFVDDIDLNDEAELTEVVSDLKELLNYIGDIESVRIMFLPDTARAHAEVTFADFCTAQKAVSVVEGLVCGGQQLHASLSLATPQKGDHSLVLVSAQDADKPAPASFPAVLNLYNLVSGDNIADEEEIQEVLSDVHELCSVFGGVQRVWIEQRESVPHLASGTDFVTSRAHRPAKSIASHLPWAVIHYSHIEDCIESQHKLSTRVVAGCSLNAQFYDVNAHQHQIYEDRHCENKKDGCENYDQYVLRLVSFVSADEIEGEEERNEVLENIIALIGSDTKTNTRFASNSLENEAVDALVFFSSLEECVSLSAGIRHQIVGGEPICADILHVQCHYPTLSLDATTCDEPLTYSFEGCLCSLICADGAIFADIRRLCDTDGSAVLVVRHYFTADDLDVECESDLVELKRDLLQLSRQAPAAQQEEGRSEELSIGFVRSVRIVRAGDANEADKEELQETGPLQAASSQQYEYVACVEYAHHFLAEDAMLHLDERVIGGVELRAVREGSNMMRGTRKVVAELEVPREEKFNVMSLNAFTTGDESVPAMIASGELLCLFTVEYVNARHSAEGKVNEEGGGVSISATAETKSVVSKYVEAQALPKLPVHSAPRLPIPCADEATNAAAKELLKLISTFQARLKEKNPLKAKQKLRFVTGLKQCINSVKAGNVKLLLLAPNTEANDVLDEKIDTLIAEAQQRAVPVCYCLSKRLLGKAAQLSMKQSAVAVLDPDGAYEYYKAVVKFVCPDR